MMTILRDRCRRCGGQLSLERDENGPYVDCLQCGWQLDLMEVRPARQASEEPAEVPKKETAVTLRMAGHPEMAVASHLGVSARQVRYWCAGVPGIPRGEGNKWRKGMPAVGLECTNSGSPCLPGCDSAGNQARDGSASPASARARERDARNQHETSTPPASARARRRITGAGGPRSGVLRYFSTD